MKNFILTIFTVSLIGLLLFFYCQNLKTSWELADVTTTTTKVIDDRLMLAKEGMKKISEAWDDLQETSQLSNLVKNSKKEITLEAEKDFFVYSDPKFGFEMKLPNNIFTNNSQDNLAFGDDEISILSFSGKYQTNLIHAVLLIDSSNQSCDNNNSEKININDIDFLCSKPVIDKTAFEYIQNCYTIKNNLCFDIEYGISNFKEKILPMELNIEDVLLKNISFIESNQNTKP